MNIKTKEASSLLVAVLAAAIVALATALAHVAWWPLILDGLSEEVEK